MIPSNIKNGVNIFGVIGNYEGNVSGGGNESNNCEAYVIDPMNPTVEFKRTDGEIKVWGYGYLESSSGWMTNRTMYAFCGDVYYKSSSYGSPTQSNLSVSIVNGKLTGLPTMSEGSVVVTKGI